MKKPTQPKAAFRLALSIFAITLSVQAKAAATAPASDNEEVFTLDEFQVSTTALKDSYIATEATAGTRTGDKIISVPYSVQVLTEDFINDFQLFEEEDIFAYIGGATANTGESVAEIRVRGFKTLQTRDGFANSIPSTPSNTLQTEVIKGPLSTLYGRATPGGIVNKISRRPWSKPLLKGSVTLGSDDYIRAAASATGPVAPDFTNNKLYYYAYYEYRHTESTEDYVKMDRQFFGLSLLYKFTPTTSLYGTLEYQPERTIEASGRVSYRPSANTTITTGVFEQAWTGGYAFSAKWGPDAGRECDYIGLNLLFEHRINTVWSARAAAQTYSKETWKTRWAGAGTFYEDTRRFSSRNPYSRDDDEASYAGQVDILARFNTNIGTRIDHRLLFAADAAFYTHECIEKQTDDVTLETDPLIPYETRYISMDNPVYLPFDYSLLKRNYSNYNHERQGYGALASYRASIHKYKLSLMASGRYDYVNSDLENHIDGGSQGSRSDEKLTYSVGLNYYLLGEKFLLYCSVSTAFLPTATIDRGTSMIVPAQNSFGYEFGFKGTNNDNTFSYTVSLYDISLENVSMDNSAFIENLHIGTGEVPEYLTDNAYSARGVEGSVYIRPISPLILQFAFGYTDTDVDSDDDKNAMGRPMRLVSEWNGALIARYSIKKGIFRGTDIGATFTYRSDYIAYYKSGVYPEVSRPSLFLFNAFVSYEWKNGKFVHKVALNGNNILNKEFYTAQGRKAYGAVGRISYTLKY